MKQTSEFSLKSTLGHTEDQVGSCNFNSGTCSPSVSAGVGLAPCDHFVKVISWYGDDFAYSNSVVGLRAHMASEE